MKISALLMSWFIFIFPWAHAQSLDSLPQPFKQSIGQLLAIKEFGSITDVKITEHKDGKMALDLTVNIGNCWGKRRLAKKLAKHTMEKLYQSNFLLAEVVVKIFSNETKLLVLALGANQAKKIQWDEYKTGTDFVNYVKSHHSAGIGAKAIEDRIFVVENQRISRPSPLLKLED